MREATFVGRGFYVDGFFRYGECALVDASAERGQALEPDDADRAFVAACALERVAMRCLAEAGPRRQIARPSIQRGTSLLSGGVHARCRPPPTQAELVASAFVRDSAALIQPRAAPWKMMRETGALHALSAVLDCAAARRRGLPTRFGRPTRMSS